MAGVNRRSRTAVRALRRLSIEEARASTITLNPKWTGAFTRSNNRRLLPLQFHFTEQRGEACSPCFTLYQSPLSLQLRLLLLT